jgi:hypothetical protein
LNDFYAFGFNEEYRLMIGDTRVVLAPKRVPIRDVKEAGLGVSHPAFITKNPRNRKSSAFKFNKVKASFARSILRKIL